MIKLILLNEVGGHLTTLGYKSEICCFTGHRIIEMDLAEMEAKLSETISYAIGDGYTHFISGAAVGFDLLCAEQVIKFKKTNKRIKLEIAIPCTDHSKKWNQSQKNRLDAILEAADIVTYVSKTTYYDGCMQVRNKYMVDKSSRVIAYFTGRPSGTKNTLKLAYDKNMTIFYIE